MLTRKRKFIAAVLLIAAVTITGCTRERGFISDNIYYVENPFTITQGVTATSSALIADGSSLPLKVQLLALRDAAGNNADSILRTPRSIVTFSGAITQQDSTLALLDAKLKDSLVRPFNINDLGGRLQFTAASKFVPTGDYFMDIAISNIRGTRVVQNACNFKIQPLIQTYHIYYNRVRYFNPTGTSQVKSEIVDNRLLEVKHTSGTPVSKVIYKFVDKNNKPFNPAKGQVKRWTFGFTASIFEDWNPYYEPVFTDSTIEHQIPSFGLSFPYFRTVVLPSGDVWEDGNPDIKPALCRYLIPASANKENLALQSFTSLDFITTGTYVVTVQFPGVERLE